MNFIDKKLAKQSPKKRQWTWFVILWFSGFFAILIVAKLIKWFMGV